MTRAKIGSAAYWDRWIEFREGDIADCESIILLPSLNKDYRPQFIFNIAIKYLELMICKYSRGDDFRELGAYFAPLLSAWANLLLQERKFLRKCKKFPQGMGGESRSLHSMFLVGGNGANAQCIRGELVAISDPGRE